MSHRLLVLAWHNIDPTWGMDTGTSAAARRGFDRQVRLLRRWTNVVPLRSALDDLSAGRPLPPRAVAITFDDGYRDNATLAAPLLHAAGLPATFFLVPDFLSATRTAWWEDLGWAFARATVGTVSWQGRSYPTATPEQRRQAAAAVAEALKGTDADRRRSAVAEVTARLAPSGPVADDPFMDWNDVPGLLRSGMAIGSHTCSHPILSRETRAVQQRELSGSRTELEAKLSRPVDVLALPNGRGVDYSDLTLQLAEAAGYRYVLTTEAGLVRPSTPPSEIRRVVVDPRTDLRAALRESARAIKRGARRRLPGRNRQPDEPLEEFR